MIGDDAENGPSPTHEELRRLRPLLRLESDAIANLADLAAGLNTISRLRHGMYTIVAGAAFIVGAILTFVGGVAAWKAWK